MPHVVSILTDSVLSIPDCRYQVLFVESGFGCDQHGQNATVRSVLDERSYAEPDCMQSLR